MRSMCGVHYFFRSHRLSPGIRAGELVSRLAQGLGLPYYFLDADT